MENRPVTHAHPVARNIISFRVALTGANSALGANGSAADKSSGGGTGGSEICRLPLVLMSSEARFLLETVEYLAESNGVLNKWDASASPRDTGGVAGLACTHVSSYPDARPFARSG